MRHTGDLLKDIASITGAPSAQLDHRPVQDLGFDSLNIAELLVLLEQYDIVPPAALSAQPHLWAMLTLRAILGYEPITLSS